MRARGPLRKEPLWGKRRHGERVGARNWAGPGICYGFWSHGLRLRAAVSCTALQRAVKA